MASIENRSRFKVTFQNREDLTQTFTHSAYKAVKAYVEELKVLGFKPKALRLNDSFVVRVRQVGYPDQTFFTDSKQEAVEIQQRIESERRKGLFVDYGKARRLSFGDLLVLDDLFLARRIADVSAELLQAIVHQRYKLRRAIVITSNRVVQDWGKYLGDATMATTSRSTYLRSPRVQTSGASSHRVGGSRHGHGL